MLPAHVHVVHLVEPVTEPGEPASEPTEPDSKQTKPARGTKFSRNWTDSEFDLS